MTGEKIVLACVLGSIGLGLGIFLVQITVDATRHALWPRGLRWFPGLWLGMGEALHRAALKIFWPERRKVFKGRKLLELESYDQQWRLWAGTSEGGIPAWVQVSPCYGRWAPRVKEKCPCGYGTECGIWCGSGHRNGDCPAHRVGTEYVTWSASDGWAVHLRTKED